MRADRVDRGLLGRRPRRRPRSGPGSRISSVSISATGWESSAMNTVRGLRTSGSCRFRGLGSGQLVILGVGPVSGKETITCKPPPTFCPKRAAYTRLRPCKNGGSGGARKSNTGKANNMKTTIWKVSGLLPVARRPEGHCASAGIGVVEKKDWDEVAAALSRGEADAGGGRRAVDDATSRAGRTPGRTCRRTCARELSHDLRTPLSAMAGWLHLMEIGKARRGGLEARDRRSCSANIDDQVRTIEKYLGSNPGRSVTDEETAT